MLYTLYMANGVRAGKGGPCAMSEVSAWARFADDTPGPYHAEPTCNSSLEYDNKRCVGRNTTLRGEI